jgi:uncharacterized membrane protein
VFSSALASAIDGYGGGMRRRIPTVASAKMLGLLLAASAGCLVLLAAHMLYSGDGTYSFLAWNLLLAAVPFALALAIETAVRHEIRASVPFLVVLWVLFLPNAPYMVTDFVHLGTDPPVPVWFDALLFSTFATIGLVFCLLSIHLLMCTASRKVGRGAAWAATAVVIAACSLGIYLGRFEQLNSWDLLVRPIAVVRVALVTGPLAREAAFTLGFTAFLIAACAAFELLIALAARPGRVGFAATPD